MSVMRRSSGKSVSCFEILIPEIIFFTHSFYSYLLSTYQGLSNLLDAGGIVVNNAGVSQVLTGSGCDLDYEALEECPVAKA